MNILVTNDDEVGAPGLLALAQAMQSKGLESGSWLLTIW
jgi:broad specificity polyphosphatase/5'/3'-nucleotidase SurE